MPSFRGKQCEVTQANYQTEAVVMTSGPLFLRLGVPNGMEELLEGLAREVLRHQPKNIYKFAAIHFEGLLLQREAGGVLSSFLI
ncbi:Hypothetical predicted protein [Cloeon dipterum]|uniref:RIIa domain-containing protein n=1 Tax=Cloeon dipterum TaxID=197152 RepID=A0A8S1D0G3_9INSE|nr:Hypothetical predicted protein [Cloeon dipterum]